MNTSDSSHSRFFGIASSRSEFGIRNDEVVGSIPTSSTNSFNSLRNDFEIRFQLLTFLLTSKGPAFVSGFGPSAGERTRPTAARAWFSGTNCAYKASVVSRFV
jgi:hypothetical protein